jgi:hypothetical protein
MGVRADTTHIKYFSHLDPPQEYKEGKNGLMFRLGIDGWVRTQVPKDRMTRRTHEKRFEG